MSLKELINSFFSKELYGQFWNNWQIHHKNTSGSIAPWLWIFLFFTVVLALFICFFATIIAMSRTKRKIREFQFKQKNENISFENLKNQEGINLEEFNFAIFFSKEENQKNFEIILAKILLTIKNETKNKKLLDFELIDIKEIQIKIVNYMKKNNIETLNDLFSLKNIVFNDLIFNFPSLNSETLNQKRIKFLSFLKQIQIFIKNEGEK